MDSPNPSRGPAGSPQSGQRQIVDRRAHPTPMVSRYLFLGRRRAGRRTGEGQRVYVDRPGGWMLFAFGLLTALSLADAFLTLDVLARGGREANPVMSAALSLGNVGFVVLKTVVTVLGAGFLCIHKNWPLGRICLWFAVAGYGGVTLWHLYGQYGVLAVH